MSHHTAQAAPLTIHVLAHSHWDREWYHSAPRFRQRLLALVEQLLHHPPDPTRPFLLDGQAVVLEDVLRVRPGLRPMLERALQSGALEAGPWYVLADELIPSGEALVRNLLAGRAVLQSFGATAPPVCYSPDAFGHTAALPVLAQGFALSVAVVWRGYGGVRWPHGDTARWTGADGSTVLLWHLPPDGYEFGRMLPTHESEAAARWKSLADVLIPRSTTGVVLLTNGADHHALQPDLDHAVHALHHAAARDGHTVVRSSLGAWAEAFAASAEEQSVPTITGELRDSYGYTWTLQGTLATRAHQKRAVAQVDALLRYDVEPWVALAHMVQHNAASELAHARAVGALTAADLVSLLQQTWRTFLRVLPHDTLCGCSVDEVARALDHRLQIVRSEAAGLRDAAVDMLLGRDAVKARDTERAAWQPRVLLRNRSARTRYGVAEVEIVQTLGDVPVGPGSAHSTPFPASVHRDAASGLLLQPLRTFDRYERRESPQHYPDNDLVRVTRALTWLPQEMALGGFALRTLPLRDVPAPAAASATASALTGRDGARANVRAVLGEKMRRNEMQDMAGSPPPVRVVKRGGTATLRNGLLSLTVGARDIQLHDVANNRRIQQLLQLTWQADRGDSYTAAPRGKIRVLKPVRARIIMRGPWRAGVAVTYALRVRTNPFVRRSASSVVRATVQFLLDADAPFLRVHVAGHDNACNHRLRMAFATGLEGAHIIADAAFGPVGRTPVHPDAVDQSREQVTTSAPLHGWVAAVVDRANTTIVSDGLAEYESINDSRLAVTLVRATGALSRATLPERAGHAGWPSPIPQAQGPGRFAARFAIAPGDVFDAAVAHNMAEDVLRPLIGCTWRDAPPDAPVYVSGITLTGQSGVVASAVKPAESGDGIIVRSVNLHEAARAANWITPWPDARVTPARLDETALAQPGTVRVASEQESTGHEPHQSGTPDSHTASASASASISLSKRAVSTLQISRA